MNKLERDYQKHVIDSIYEMFGSEHTIIQKMDPNYIQGIPDLLVIYKDCWFALETKQSKNAHHQPNQDYYVEWLNNMSFASFIYPENEKEVLSAMSRFSEKSNNKRRYDLKGKHATFPASQPAWLRYDDDKLISVYRNKKAMEMGTKLHEWAEHTIKLGIMQPKKKNTLYSFVNDAIGFHLDTEVPLYYSDNFFGTADAIGFSDGVLRIHDLKTGQHKASMDQLLVYAALYCLNEDIKTVKNMKFVLRIYQSDEIVEYEPAPAEILDIMDAIVHKEKVLKKYEEGEHE